MLCCNVSLQPADKVHRGNTAFAGMVRLEITTSRPVSQMHKALCTSNKLCQALLVSELLQDKVPVLQRVFAKSKLVTAEPHLDINIIQNIIKAELRQH